MSVHVITAAPERPDGRRSRWRPNREQLFAVFSPLVVMVAWEIATRTGRLDQRIYSKPTEVAHLGWELITSGTLLGDIAVTLLRLLRGMALGAVPGLVLGALMGVFRWPRAIVNPLIKITYPLPRVALFPLVILIIGSSELSYSVMVATGPFFTMVVSAMAAVMNVEPIYFRVAKSFGVSTVDLYRRVVLPAAMPIIFSGLQLSLGVALIGVVAVEFLMTDNGLGYMIWRSWQVLSLEQSMVGLVATGLLGYVLFSLLDRAKKFLIPWAPQRQA